MAEHNMYQGKKILVTGGTGLIGIPLVRKLLELGARVRVVSLDPSQSGSPDMDVEYIQGNLTDWETCKRAVRGMDYVFHLAGTKGGVSVGTKKAASFFVPHLIFNTLTMEAARVGDIDRYLFTSTIGIYPPAPLYIEDRAWDGPPEGVNRFPGWAKRMGELQAEAYKLEFGWDKIAIVRPSNVYGPFDYFDGFSSMVIPSLIHRAAQGENPLTVWGDGTGLRDFVYSEDVADGMLLAMEKAADCIPINLGSGKPTSIKELADTLCACIPGLTIHWDSSQPKGAERSVLDISRAREKIGYAPKVSLQEGLKRTLEWYHRSRKKTQGHYNVFLEKELIG